MILIYAESYARAFREAQERGLLFGEWAYISSRSELEKRDRKTSRVVICGQPELRRDYDEMKFHLQKWPHA